MSKRYPCGGSRRKFFRRVGQGVAAATLTPLMPQFVTAMPTDEEDRNWGIPGPYPGRVVEVAHTGMIKDGIRNGDAIANAMQRGMTELVGVDSSVEAWRSFFEPGEVVGIKVNPVGYPLAPTSTEVLLETIKGVRSAGVRPEDIVIFDRYRSEFLKAGFNKNLPDGVRWDGLTRDSDPTQLEIAGYDPDEYISMELVHSGHDPKDDRTRRSHLGLLMTKEIDKLICLNVLKDHGSAGVTLALKNMSHGLVNNVARSHSGPHYNVCNQFIPEVVSHPIIRQKAVLQILDGIKGVYQGGPFATKAEWTWERNSLFFATDPVAMDRVGWEIIDGQRKRKGLAPVGAVGRMAIDADREGFDIRQPQHIPLAGALGLGVFDKDKIDHHRVSIE